VGTSDANASSRIFISYRRDETAYPASWLYDRLKAQFGTAQIFKDVDNIRPGDDFVDRITSAVGSCDVLLAVIGPQWATVTDTLGRRRIDDPDDFVRLEVETALNRNVRVIPLLVDHAEMPNGSELPEPLAPLVRKHALELSPSHFTRDAEELVAVLGQVLTPAPTVLRLPESEPTVVQPPGPGPDPQAAPTDPLPLLPSGNTPSVRITDARWFRTALMGAVCLLVIAGLIFVADRSLRPETTSSSTNDGFSLPPVTLPKADQALPADELIWRRERDERYTIERIGLDGQVRKILTDTQQEYAASLTPDRRTLLYLRRVDKVGSLTTLRAKSVDGNGDRALFTDHSQACPILTQPAIRDDGLLAVVCQDNFEGPGSLRLMTLDGRVVHELARGYVADPTFTRDGQSVVYSKAPFSKADGGDLFKVSWTSGTQTVPITKGAVDTDPVSSPTSDEIAFRRMDGDQSVIAVVDPSSGPDAQPKTITSSEEDAGPSWSPDGSQIVFRRGPEKGKAALYLIDANGTGQKQVVENDGDYASVPIWTAH